MTISKLREKAHKAGVECRDVDCKSCKGRGKFLRPEPLDLQRLRERHGASIYAFAKFAKVHSSMVKRIEEADPDKGQPCSERLLLAYLEIPKQTWKSKPGKKTDPSGLSGLTFTEQRALLAQRREARERRKAMKRPEEHVKRGEIWEKGDTRYRVLQVGLGAEVTDNPTVLLQALDRDGARPFTARASAVVAKYRKVEAAA